MEEAPRDRHGAWDRWKPRLLCFGLGVALGTFGIQVILRSFPSSAPPLTKNPSSGRDRAPVKPPARTGKKPPVAAKPPDPVPEPVRREAGALFFQHEEKLRLRLPEPRPGTPPHHIGKTSHPSPKSPSPVLRPTGLARSRRRRSSRSSGTATARWWSRRRSGRSTVRRLEAYWAERRTPTDTVRSPGTGSASVQYFSSASVARDVQGFLFHGTSNFRAIHADSIVSALLSGTRQWPGSWPFAGSARQKT